MSAQSSVPDHPRRLPRFLHFLRRWSWRGMVVVALANLSWDLWSWHDRSFAEGDRRYFRGAERGDEIDYGLADIRIINETDRAFLIDSFVLDGWGGPYTHEAASARTLAPVGQPGASRDESRYLDQLVGEGRLLLRDGANGMPRLITFVVDRRRPVSCQLDLYIREDGETLSDCRPLRRIRHDFRWLFGPPNY